MKNFKPSAYVTRVTNGYTVEISFPKEGSEDRFDQLHEEYIFATKEEAIGKVNEYLDSF